MAGTFSVVDRAVKNALPQSPLRVFTLGIGDSVSSAMCEGIARAGRGACSWKDPLCPKCPGRLGHR